MPGSVNLSLTHIMGNKIKTEADRRATPPLPGERIRAGAGRRRSQARGGRTPSKKNPAPRPPSG